MEQLSFGLIVTDPQAHRLQAQRKTRKCLSCLDEFASTGPGNRICAGCKQLSAWSTPNDFSVSTAF